MSGASSVFAERLATGERILIDGATGTELERRGVPMVQGAWTGDAARTHPDELREIHRSHIAVGAELIIANTFASSRHLLAFGGLEQHFELLNRRGIELALEAREEAGRPDVVVAGSMSTSRQGGPFPTIEDARRNFADQAAIQADAGAEVIILEMMRDLEQTDACLQAALDTRLPVWLGWSCFTEGHDEPMLWEGGHTLRAGMAEFGDSGVEAVAIMHSEVEDVEPCLRVLADCWDGPVGAYAHSGDFVHPNWVFNGVISEQDYAAHALRWLDLGVQIIGGCCGITCDHIDVLREAVESHATR
ncbi:MAG: homocysteine S-methyltransferase family protein [Actinomycetota bacterium]